MAAERLPTVAWGSAHRFGFWELSLPETGQIVEIFLKWWNYFHTLRGDGADRGPVVALIAVVPILHKEAVARDGAGLESDRKIVPLAANRWKIPTNSVGFSRGGRFAW